MASPADLYRTANHLAAESIVARREGAAFLARVKRNEARQVRENARVSLLMSPEPK